MLKATDGTGRPRRATPLPLILAAGLMVSGQTLVAGPCPEDRECVGLVLAGGGARGAAHVGVLEVMEELRIPVDFIVGTSMGAIVGGMYASGLSPSEMREYLTEIDWEAAFNDDPPRRHRAFRQKEDDDKPLFKFEFGFSKDGMGSPKGLVAGQKLNFILRSLLVHQSSLKHFDDLPIPYRAIAVDLNSGEMVSLEQGDLATAIRASMAYPVAFTPVEIDGQMLVDGGVLRNLPVDVALELGADRLIAVDVGTPLGKGKDPSGALAMVMRTISVMNQEGRAHQRELIREQDLLITPDLEGITAFASFGDVGEAIEKGVESAREHEDELRQFSVTEKEFADFLERHRAPVEGDVFQVDQVEIIGLERVSAKRVSSRMSLQPGELFTIDKLRSDLEKVYQIGEFEQVGFAIADKDDERVLQVRAREKSWGPWFYRLGMALATDLSGSGDFTVNALLRRPNLNRLGAEWKSFVTLGSLNSFSSEYYQPLDYRGTYFVAGNLRWLKNSDETVFVNGSPTLLDSRRRTAGVDFGIAVRNTGEFRIGPRVGRVKGDLAGGMASIDDRVGFLRTRFKVDRLDNANFPRSGTAGLVELTTSREALGADVEYDRLTLSVGHAWELGKWTQLVNLRLGHNLGSDVPVYDEFALGGFSQLSGLQFRELRGVREAFLILAPYRKIGEIPSIFGGDLYLGGTLEAGNVWTDAQLDDASIEDLRLAGSVWGGVDTLFGPLYLAYGLTDGGNSSWYLFLGRVFGANIEDRVAF